MVTAAGSVLPDITLRNPADDAVQLSDLITRRTVIPVVRYYGCMPCRDYLFQLQEQTELLADADLDVIGIGRAADFQAEWLGSRGIKFPLLLDPDEAMYDAIDLARFPWWKMLTWSTGRNYLRAAKRARQGRMANHPLQRPGLLVLDPGLEVVALHRGETLGDYPPVADVVAAART
jgi:peroxiredoxin